MRVAYRGREDGWILSANNRGPTLVPLEDLASAAAGFDAQEVSFDTAEAVPEPSHADDRSLNASRGKKSWVPPTEFPQDGHEGAMDPSNGGSRSALGRAARAASAAAGDQEHAEALREEQVILAASFLLPLLLSSTVDIIYI